MPDLRGFGGSSHPGDVQASGTMGDLVGDLVCILEHANVRGAICVGWELDLYEYKACHTDLGFKS